MNLQGQMIFFDKVNQLADKLMNHYKVQLRTGGCMYHTIAGMWYLQKAGLHPVYQAGTLNWPLSQKGFEEFSEDEPTHFSYQFDEIEAVRALTNDCPPEMHVWLALPKEQVIIDTTTQFIPAQCERILGIKMNYTPPKFIWWTRQNFENYKGPGVHYTPNRSAIRIVAEYMQKYMDNGRPNLLQLLVHFYHEIEYQQKSIYHHDEDMSS